MQKYIIKKAIFVRGKMLKVGSSIVLNENEAKELLVRGVVEKDEKIPLNITSIEEMKKDELVEYAASIGIEIPNKATKDEIINLLKEVDE